MEEVIYFPGFSPVLPICRSSGAEEKPLLTMMEVPAGTLGIPVLKNRSVKHRFHASFFRFIPIASECIERRSRMWHRVPL